MEKVGRWLLGDKKDAKKIRNGRDNIDGKALEDGRREDRGRKGG